MGNKFRVTVELRTAICFTVYTELEVDYNKTEILIRLAEIPNTNFFLDVFLISISGYWDSSSVPCIKTYVCKGPIVDY